MQILALSQTPAAIGQVVNVCSGVETPVRAFVDALCLLADKPVMVEVEVQRMRPGQPARLYGCTARLRSLGIIPALPDVAAMTAQAYQGPAQLG